MSRNRIYGVTISTRYFPANRRAGHYVMRAVTVWARVGGSGAGGFAGTGTTACAAPIPIVSAGVGTYPASVISAPPCDGRAAVTPYANFAAAFNAGNADQAAAQFGALDVGGGDQIWWDPSRPNLMGYVNLGQLPAHFAKLYQLDVRLPPTIKPNPLGDLPGLPGFGSFDFNDHGFSGRGVVICQTGKIFHLIIDGWTPAIAGQTPPGVTTPPCVDGVTQNCHT